MKYLEPESASFKISGAVAVPNLADSETLDSKRPADAKHYASGLTDLKRE